MGTDTKKMAAPLVVGPGEGQAVWFRANRITVLASAATTGGAFSLSEVLAAPGDSPPLHIQHEEEESFYLLEGRMRFRLDDRTIEAGPGTLVTIPRGMPHSFLVEGSKPARHAAGRRRARSGDRRPAPQLTTPEWAIRRHMALARAADRAACRRMAP